jgi:RimJ/RimL family protein N-acetyltransferase
MYKEFETSRLRIRPINLNDAGFVHRLLNSEGWLDYIGDRNIRDMADAENYIQKILDNKQYFYSVFERKDSNDPLGLVTFLLREDQEFPDIGFAILPEYESKGYAYEASRKYLDEILRSGAFENVIAITLPRNRRSIKLLKKLGLAYASEFSKDGQKLVRYSLSHPNLTDS